MWLWHYCVLELYLVWSRIGNALSVASNWIATWANSGARRHLDRMKQIVES